MVGEDFKFGHNRKGTATDLMKIGNAFGIEVTIAPLITEEKLEISSTAIRKALAEGKPDTAFKMLGDWYSIVGSVSEGDKRGRTLGFPTINLSMNNLHLPKLGVYSSNVEVLTGSHKGLYLAAVSIGERPTYGKNQPNLEAHLLDFTGNLYGEQVSVSLVCYQRPEMSFSSSEELVKQMRVDCRITRDNLTSIKKDV